MPFSFSVFYIIPSAIWSTNIDPHVRLFLHSIILFSIWKLFSLMKSNLLPLFLLPVFWNQVEIPLPRPMSISFSLFFFLAFALAVYIITYVFMSLNILWDNFVHSMKGLILCISIILKIIYSRDMCVSYVFLALLLKINWPWMHEFTPAMYSPPLPHDLFSPHTILFRFVHFCNFVYFVIRYFGDSSFVFVIQIVLSS